MQSETISNTPGAVLGVPEQVTVQNVEEVRADFLAAVASATGGVTLDLSAVKKVDVTFFQLILALEVSLRGSGRFVRFAGMEGDHPVRRSAALLGMDIERFSGAAGAAG